MSAGITAGRFIGCVLVGLAVGLAVSPPGLSAQGVTTAGLFGRVLDDNGGPVAGARVEFRHVATGATYATVSDEAGRFGLSNLRPGGPYTLEVTRIGLSPVTREDLTLSAGQRLRLEVRLSETPAGGLRPLARGDLYARGEPDLVRGHQHRTSHPREPANGAERIHVRLRVQSPRGVREPRRRRRIRRPAAGLPSRTAGANLHPATAGRGVRTGHQDRRPGAELLLRVERPAPQAVRRPALRGCRIRLQPLRRRAQPRVVASATAVLPRPLGGGRLSLLYVGQSGRPYSYVYADDINGDTYPGFGRALDLANDLIFVTESAFDFPGGGRSPVSGILFEQLVAQEPCLEESRLRIMHRNSCRTPWSNELDFRFSQPLRLGGAEVTLTLDVLNVLNLINREWGHVQTVNPVVQLLSVKDRVSGIFNPGGLFPEDPNPLRARYAGPLQFGDTGGVRAAVPYLPQIGASQWQAPFGIGIRFR